MGNGASVPQSNVTGTAILDNDKGHFRSQEQKQVHQDLQTTNQIQNLNRCNEHSKKHKETSAEACGLVNGSLDAEQECVDPLGLTIGKNRARIGSLEELDLLTSPTGDCNYLAKSSEDKSDDDWYLEECSNNEQNELNATCIFLNETRRHRYRK